ncbi:MAG: nucleotide pyrophosphohydrolase [Candidatus Heimdallarchaeaceae archaeon]
MSINTLVELILKFRNERNWSKYHTPKNLALSLIIEVGELFEIFQWKEDQEIKNNLHLIHDKLEEELADVAIYLFLLASELNVDLEKAIPKKINQNSLKYPINSLSEEEIKWGK